MSLSTEQVIYCITQYSKRAIKGTAQGLSIYSLFEHVQDQGLKHIGANYMDQISPQHSTPDTPTMSLEHTNKRMWISDIS